MGGFILIEALPLSVLLSVEWLSLSLQRRGEGRLLTEDHIYTSWSQGPSVLLGVVELLPSWTRAGPGVWDGSIGCI